MSEIVIAIMGLSGTLLIALLGLYGAKKYNIGPNQEKLVETLKDIVAAQEDRIKQLEENSKRIPFLEDELKRLNNLVVAQLVRIQELELELERKRNEPNLINKVVK